MLRQLDGQDRGYGRRRDRHAALVTISIVYGSLASANDVYHYTDEFLAMAALAGESGRTSLADLNGGIDWIDAAAVTGNVVLNLATGATVNGARLVHDRRRHRDRECRDRRRQRHADRQRARQHPVRRTRRRHRGVLAGLSSYAPQDLGLRIAISGLDGSDTLYGFEHLQFTDGTVNVNDGNPLFDTLFYMRNNLDVFHAGVDALVHYNAFGCRRRARSERLLRYVGLLWRLQGRRRGRASIRSIIIT